MRHSLPGTRALRTFEAAGRHLNFTRAAEEVGLTPAAVSYQIKELEDQLGAILFTRTSRLIQLTPAGATMLQAASEALDGWQSALTKARKLARGSAQLRISLSARFAANWLLPRLPRFRAAHPDLALTFDITDQLRDFESDDIDIAIRFSTADQPGTQSEHLFDMAVAPVCSPKLLETGPKLESPRDLLHHTLCYLDWRADGMVWPNWRMWMAAAGIADFDDSRCLAFPDSSHIVQAALAGGVVSLAGLALVGGDLAEGRLVRPFETSVNVAPGYAYRLVYPTRGVEDARIRAFCDWIKTEIS